MGGKLPDQAHGRAPDGAPAGVVLFFTTSSALRAEKLLKRSGLEVKLIPTPRELSSDCGVALRFHAPSDQAVSRLLRDAGVEVARICWPFPG